MKKVLLIPTSILLPTIAFAQTGAGPYVDSTGHGLLNPGVATGFDAVINRASEILDALIPIMVILALVYFIYGLAEYILESGVEAKKVEGKNRMVRGSIAMFLIVSVWGVVLFIQKTVGIENSITPPAPKLMK